jgi:hypothetical protein
MYSGLIRGTLDDSWRKVDSSLRLGLRGLPGGSSLARLLAEERGVRNITCLPPLKLNQILRWADRHRQQTGSWPNSESGAILDEPGENWRHVDNCLRIGMRDLPGGSSLARLLAQRRGVRNIQNLPPLTQKQVLAWADAHHRRTGRWPNSLSGPIAKAPGESWSGVNTALQAGRRGFPGGSSLARLLARRRGVRNPKQPPLLTVPQILRWADAYHRRTGTWPSRGSGPVDQFDGETWAMIDRALQNRKRGLRVRISLFRLLLKKRKIRG